MEIALIPPANYLFFSIPTVVFSILIPIVGVVFFIYIMVIRLAPLLEAAPDACFNNLPERLIQLAKIWLIQYRQPRYLLAGVLHIIIFVGFLILSIRSTAMVILGVFPDFVVPGLGGPLGSGYSFIKDYAATSVLVACVIACVRRGVFRPERYAVPVKYGKDHTWEALFVLGLISTLMISESLFEGTLVAAQVQKGIHAELLPPLTLSWLFKNSMLNASLGTMQSLHIIAYYVHDLTFFFFLCFLPLGKHFHVITSFFNVLFMRIQRGNIKPVQHGVSDEQLDDLEFFGVKKLEDFTWKHILDFYSCADCGRCSDNCPANAVGRPLSPRFISIKGRDLVFKNYPIYPFGASFLKSEPLIGSIYEEDEIWSCTTCGACEQECPLGIEYIDKMVDLRRSMVDDGMVPQTLQKALGALEKRGNPWGKMEKKRADWTKFEDFNKDCPVKILGRKESADTLYFVDSISSFDDRMQEIARATAKVLSAAGVDFGILGKAERDSGHEVRRFGEEMLFVDLKERNSEAISNSGVNSIVTSDPHAFNALKSDYQGMPPVEHTSQVIIRNIKSGKIRLKGLEDSDTIFTYHDSCYLGRHNGIYDEPRAVIDAIPGAKRVEMAKCKDRSFCCGGGGLSLFYEPVEEKRMGQVRVEMAIEAGANVIVTACPFCLVQIEDAIKTTCPEGNMTAIDLVELIERHIIEDS